MLTPAYYLFTVVVYVTFRSSRPDIVTWLRVLKELLKNKIDITRLVIWSTNHCQQTVPSKERGRSARVTLVQEKENNFLCFQTFWTTEYISFMQTFVPELRIKYT